MSVVEAVLLGVIQGVTEFLPISSTAHLTLAGKMLGIVDTHAPEAWTAFIAVMQLGTLLAVLLFFRKDVAGMTTCLVRDVKSRGGGRGIAGITPESRLALLIVLGTVPVGLLGYGFKDIIEGAFTKTMLVIIASLVALAAILWIAEKVARHSRTLPDVTWRDALLIGLAQALALIPGSSRSGTTITGALLLGFSREAAARFSFLLSIPAVFASGLYEMTKLHGIGDLGIVNLVVATGVSAGAGYAAIAWLLRYLMKNTTLVFVWYRIALGLLLTLLVLQDVLQP
ncbi:MAG: undecaprenyl-diphosphatase UppP [Bacteroidota bacterium]